MRAGVALSHQARERQLGSEQQKCHQKEQRQFEGEPQG
jgi:hypothetical protein